MPRENPDYFDVDKVAAQPDAAQRVARYFGVSEDEMHLTGKELRTRCFLQCGKKSPTGDRVLAIQVTHAAAVQFHGPLTPGDFVHLPKYQAYVALMVAGRTCDPFLMQTIRPPASYLSDANFRTLVDLSRQRYAQPAARVDRRLARGQTVV